MKFELKVLVEDEPSAFHLTVKHGDDTLGHLYLTLQPVPGSQSIRENRDAMAGVLLASITEAARRTAQSGRPR